MSVTSRALVDQEDHHVGVGVVGQDAVGDLLEQDGLARPGRGDDQPALALADRRDHVDDPHVQLVAPVLQDQPPSGWSGVRSSNPTFSLRRSGSS
jgi:hypothetical protein